MAGASTSSTGHCTPWGNQAEIWFGIFQGPIPKYAGFKTPEAMAGMHLTCAK